MKALALAAALGCAALVTPAPAEQTPFARRAEVQAFIAEMAARHGFAAPQLAATFARARPLPEVLRAIEPQAQPRSWVAYRAIFLDEARVRAGSEFLRAHAPLLARAEERWGVPEKVIAAILGVESFYGRQTGRYRVFEALATLAFGYAPRQAYFRSELEHFLLYARSRGLDPLAPRGSYAGAMGIPQFMPGSLLAYAVDFDGDGHVDLEASLADAIGSVAHFLARHGWRRGEPAAVPARVRGESWRSHVGGVAPRQPFDELQRAGVDAEGAPAAALAVLIELATPGAASEFRVGFHNFWVITRYNRSSFYAAAVVDLAQAIAEAR